MRFAKLLLVVAVVVLSGCAATAYKTSRAADLKVTSDTYSPFKEFVVVMKAIPFTDTAAVEITSKHQWYGLGGYVELVGKRLVKNAEVNGVVLTFVDQTSPYRAPEPLVVPVKTTTVLLTPTKYVTSRRSDGVTSYSIVYKATVFVPRTITPQVEFSVTLMPPSVFDKEYVADTFVIPFLNTLGDAKLIVLPDLNAKVAP